MRRHARRTAFAVLLLAIGTGALAGCQKALFPKDGARTQFDSHDRMRGGFTPLEEPDVFGNPQPALRERLTRQD